MLEKHILLSPSLVAFLYIILYIILYNVYHFEIFRNKTDIPYKSKNLLNSISLNIYVKYLIVC